MRQTACAILFALMLLSSSSADERPNIVFLMSDDQSTYSMGCYGTPDVKTPNMDRLARDGMIFDHHYVTTAICMASRANVVTGMYEFKSGCNFQHGDLLRQHWENSYPVLLRENGYRTAFAGKFGFLVTEKPGEKGLLPTKDFDVWGGGPGQTSYETAKNNSLTKYAKDFPHSTLAYGAFGRDFVLDSAKKDDPFCLSISFKAPHKPASPDAKFNDVYRGVKFTKPKNYGRKKGAHFSQQSRQGRQYPRFHSWNYSDKYDEVMATYHQQIYAIDAAIGVIRKAIEDAGVSENTVVIYTSDNGFFCGSHGYGSKVLPYEESSRVPLIIYDPRHKNSGKRLRCSALTGNIDFAPTILSLANVKIPDNIDGRNLMKLYDNPQGVIHEYLALINVWGPTATYSLAVVTEHWKYINWPYDVGDFERTEELYDLQNDRLELRNLVAEESVAAQLKRIREVYDRTVTKWKNESVSYHKYKKLGDWFARD